jgi:hypothetical protein
MAVAAAFEQSFIMTELESELYAPALVFEIPQLDSDKLIRLRAARFIGAVALGEERGNIESNGVEQYSLMNAIHAAAEGDPTAQKLVETNVHTDVVERTIKSGHILKVSLETNEAGQILQHGQTAESIQANSLRFAADSWQMRERTEAETRNMFRIDEAHRQGLLDDYAFIVFSRAADNMTETEMDEVGFFTETMSCAIQITTTENGIITTESAFVAGRKTQDAPRHDRDTIVRLGESLGADMSHKTATEIIDTPLLVHKSLLPNGAADIVKLYDDHAEGTFFGEDKPRQNYVAYKEVCRQRENGFEPKVKAIVGELIAEAHTIHDPIQATQRLGKISERHMVEFALKDKTINSRVFGRVAAGHIENARLQFELGNVDQASAEMSRAKATAVSRSCPSGANNGGGEPLADNGSKDENEDKYGSLSFKCPRGHANTRPHGKLISNCRVCGTSVKC